jgi:hypothetical protein
MLLSEYLDKSHLTPIAGAELVAWHRLDDVQSVRFASGEEALFVSGRRILLTEDYVSPTQHVINYCRYSMRSRHAQAIRKAWLALAVKP